MLRAQGLSDRGARLQVQSIHQVIHQMVRQGILGCKVASRRERDDLGGVLPILNEFVRRA